MKRLVLTASLALAACPPPPAMDAGVPDSGSDVDAGVDAGRPVRDAGVDAGWFDVAEASWCHDRAVAQCWRDMRCGSVDDSRLDDCVKRRALPCDQNAYNVSAQLGFHLYDSKQAARCLDAYDHGSCELEPAACSSVFAGRSQPGGGFSLVPEDCDPDAGYVSLYDDDTCPRLCHAWAGLGDDCTDSAGQYFRTNYLDGGMVRSCKPGVFSCDNPDGGFDQFCLPLQRPGDHCEGYWSCGPGTVCAMTSNKCIDRYSDTGSLCDVDDGYPYCRTEDFCKQASNDAGICTKRPGIGGTCTGYGSCLPSLHCTSTIGTGVCERRRAQGEICSSSISVYPDCIDGLHCSNATSRCVPDPTDGGDCGYDSESYNQCATGYYCALIGTQQCFPKIADGELCPTYPDDACQSGFCFRGPLNDGGVGYRCARCTSDGGG